jgi:heme-degrading monooxygenase HmoA
MTTELTGEDDPVVASFHLLRYPRCRIPFELMRFVTQRRALRRSPGLRFARILGTARGRSMSLSADLSRWALFAVWDDDAALEEFLATSPVSAHWRRRSTETWIVGLEPLAAHGAWDGVNPLGHRHAPTVDVAPLAVLTRATVRARHWPAFYRAAATTEPLLVAAPGLLASIGVGERPVGRQATFSLWASASAIGAFAYGTEHAETVRRTRAGRWYAEELFARFRPYRSAGTWDGSDPLRGLLADRPARERTDAGTTGNSIP